MPRLTADQSIAVAALAAGENVEQVAARIGCHRSTVHRWQHRPEFVAAVGSIQQQASAAAVDRLRQLQGAAIDTLEQALQGAAGFDGAARLRAATWLLEVTGCAKRAASLPPASVDGVEQQQTARLIAELAG